MNLLGNNADLSVVTATAAAVKRSVPTEASDCAASNLSSSAVISATGQSTRATATAIPWKGSGFPVQEINNNNIGSKRNFQRTMLAMNNSGSRSNENCIIEREMAFTGNGNNMNANLVHHQHNMQQQQQQHMQSMDDISDLRPNSLNNILKNNIISGGNDSLMTDINNNSSNDLNLSDDQLCNGNVSPRAELLLIKI